MTNVTARIPASAKTATLKTISHLSCVDGDSNPFREFEEFDTNAGIVTL